MRRPTASAFKVNLWLNCETITELLLGDRLWCCQVTLSNDLMTCFYTLQYYYLIWVFCSGSSFALMCMGSYILIL